jgi:hypothetical protein
VYEAAQQRGGLLLKTAPSRRLVGGVRVVATGDGLLAPSITRRLLEEGRPHRAAESTVGPTWTGYCKNSGCVTAYKPSWPSGWAAEGASVEQKLLMDNRYEIAVGTGILASTSSTAVRCPHRRTHGGVTVEADFTGGHLLHLAAAGCILNYLYREAASGQRGRPVPRHRPDRDTQTRQVRGERASDLAGPEHHLQPGLTHDTGPLADPQVTRRSATAQPRRLSPTLRWSQFTSNRFLEIVVTLDRAGVEPRGS